MSNTKDKEAATMFSWEDANDTPAAPAAKMPPMMPEAKVAEAKPAYKTDTIAQTPAAPKPVAAAGPQKAAVNAASVVEHIDTTSGLLRPDEMSRRAAGVDGTARRLDG